MGEHVVKKLSSAKDRATYNKQLINDIAALEMMLNMGMIEESPLRIGAEQEFCLIDTQGSPSAKALEVLGRISDNHFTTEIAKYNLEANLDPIVLNGRCFSKMHAQLNAFITKADKAAKAEDSRILLTGILPSIVPEHLEDSFMVPAQRYLALNETLAALRGKSFDLRIKGADEVNLMHHSVLFEGCNTSFQVHLQIQPDDFTRSYNWAQAIAGPILSVCTNSPLLLGRELWSETRIALFNQSIDTRASAYHLHEREARVSFGENWAKGTAVDIYKENILRFRSILTSDSEADSLWELSEGRIPKLKALALHNGTVYRWNRPCYGVTDGKPHLRIECRYIPSGPTVTDEIANTMLWIGVMSGRPQKYDDMSRSMHFKDVKSNFFNAARYGMASQMYWEGELIAAGELVLEKLIPMAKEGLNKMHVDSDDIEYYLNIIKERIETIDGSRWMQLNYRKLREEHKRIDACRMLTKAIYENQKIGTPVSSWQDIEHVSANGWERKTVRQCMIRKVITAQEKDSARLAAKLMQWREIHHLPIIDAQGKLSGLVSWSDMQAMEESDTTVSDFMRKEVIVVNPTESMKMARSLMNEHQIGCLPVVSRGALVGIITQNDF